MAKEEKGKGEAEQGREEQGEKPSRTRKPNPEGEKEGGAILHREAQREWKRRRDREKKRPVGTINRLQPPQASLGSQSG